MGYLRAASRLSWSVLPCIGCWGGMVRCIPKLTVPSKEMEGSLQISNEISRIRLSMNSWRRSQSGSSRLMKVEPEPMRPIC